MAPFGTLAVNPDRERLERLRRGLEGLHSVVKGAVVDPLMLPGDVAAGKFNTTPSTPGMWSDEDEARAQLNDRQALARAVDLGGMVMTSTLPAVASHVAQHGTKGLTNPDTLGIFAGAGALTADQNKLALAQRMKKEGATPADIWDATGWFQGADKKWRFEIDDSKMTVRPDAARRGYDTKLGDIVDHPEFFAAYPSARDIRMSWGEPPGRGGYTQPAFRGDHERISLSQFDKPEVHRSIGLHEMQHAVQERENFARGGNTHMFTQQDDAKLARDALSWRKELDRTSAELPPQAREEAVLQQYRDIDAHDFIPPQQARLIAHDLEGNPTEQLEQIVSLYGLDKRATPYTPMEMYRRLAGEVEARNVQARRDLSPQQRRAMDPRYSQDTQFPDQVVRGEYTMDDLDDLLAGKAPLRPLEHAPLEKWDPVAHMNRAREERLPVNRYGADGGGGTRMLPSQEALAARRGGDPEAGSWERAVAEAKSGFQHAKSEAREIMNKARADVQSWKTLADDEAFLATNPWLSTDDVPPINPRGGQMDLSFGSHSKKIGNTDLTYTVGRDGAVEINMMKTPEAERGKGGARTALQTLLRDADAQGVPVRLTAEPMDARTSAARLRKFYESMGFVRNAGRNRDFSTRAEYIRQPKADSGNLLTSMAGGVAGLDILRRYGLIEGE